MASAAKNPKNAGPQAKDNPPEVDADYFCVEDGVRFAGRHVILDFWGCDHLDNADFIDRALRKAAADAGATILHGHFHCFSPYGGVTGVLVLAESHISIHTWPERSFAAIDIFMCGGCDAQDAAPALKRAFQPSRISVVTERRGVDAA